MYELSRRSAKRPWDAPSRKLESAFPYQGAPAPLVLHCRDGVIDFGKCLSLDERREVAPLQSTR